MRLLKCFTMLLFLIPLNQVGMAQKTDCRKPGPDTCKVFTLKNELVTVRIQLDTAGSLLEDCIFNSHFQVKTDADFALDVIWTDWRAPGKQNNADNPALLTKKDFKYSSRDLFVKGNGSYSIILNFSGKNQPLLLQVTYDLDNGKNYYRRKIKVSDTTQETHFLKTFYAREGKISSYKDMGLLIPEILKKGDFGQLIAIRFGDGGMFAGMEYPASTNEITSSDEINVSFRCYEESGNRITRNGLESDWVVIGLVSDPFVKKAFLEYVKDIRVMPALPFTLYNSWYDLRSPEYPSVKPGNVIDKFTNDVMLYFARGISMFELYISPDLLSDAEWDAIGKGINWAKDRKEILANTFMVGGDPTRRETYGYTHFKGSHGILAARNPVMQTSHIGIKLDPAQGLDPKAKNLIVETIYPYRYIFPDLYSAGDTVDIVLEGFEMAVLEIYPIEESAIPLFTGLPFDGIINKDGSYSLNFYGFSPKTKLLNPGITKSMLVNNTKGLRLEDLPQPRLRRPVLQDYKFNMTGQKGKETPEIEMTLDSTGTEASLSLLFKPGKEDAGKELPIMSFTVDGKDVKAQIEKEKGLWAWYTFKLSAGTHIIAMKPATDTTNWKGSIQAWFLCKSPSYKQTILFKPVSKYQDRIMPALPMQQGIFEHHFELGEKEIQFKP